jgi:hypothetical protein
MRKVSFILALLLTATFLTAGEGDAPATPPAPGNGRGNRGGNGGAGGGGRGNFDPAQFAQQREERMKKDLGVNDEEWKALQPKIDALDKARMAGFGGGQFGRRGGPGGQGGNADEATKTDLQKKQDSLKKLLDDKDSDPKAIATALKDLRDERVKGKESLKKAQDELKELLTARQEASMVLSGRLE